MNTTPIEFMAWDTRHEKLFNVLCIHHDQIDYDDDAETTFNAYMPQYGYQSRGEVYPMQLTALRSTTGEKIYNHMIVKNEFGSHYVVDMFNYELMYVLTWSTIEIVGNVFQHSGLLELCK